MKQLLEVIALYLLGINALQILLSLVSVVMLLKIFAEKILDNRRMWLIRKRNSEIENNMWAIE